MRQQPLNSTSKKHLKYPSNCLTSVQANYYKGVGRANASDEELSIASDSNSWFSWKVVNKSESNINKCWDIPLNLTP